MGFMQRYDCKILLTILEKEVNKLTPTGTSQRDAVDHLSTTAIENTLNSAQPSEEDTTLNRSAKKCEVHGGSLDRRKQLKKELRRIRGMHGEKFVDSDIITGFIQRFHRKDLISLLKQQKNGD